MSARIGAMVLVVGLPVAGLVLMVSAMLVPDRPIMDELFDAVESGAVTENSYSLGYTGAQLDGFSECKRITIGLGAPDGTNVLEAAVRTPSLGPCERAVPKIRGWAAGDGLEQAYSYQRYWNGSATVFRPVLAVVGVEAARVLFALGVAAAAGAFWFELARRVGRPAATIGVAPLVLTTDFIDLPGALFQALGVTVALAAAAAVLRYVRGDALAFGTAAFLSGAVFLFLGDMTNPDAAWVLTASGATVVAVSTSPLRAAAARSAAVWVGWIGGFAWMWLSKWLISVPILGFDAVWSEVRRQIEFRLSGETPGGYSGSLTGSARGAVEYWLDQPLTPLVLAVVLVAAVVLARRHGTLASTWRQRLLIAAPAVIPLAWHLVLRNHTHFHGWFTYRSFAVAFGVLAMALAADLTLVGRDDDTEPGADDDSAQVRYGSTASGSMS